MACTISGILNPFQKKNFSEEIQIGVIAQEVEKLFPEMVYTDEEGYKSVDYSRLTPVLIEAVKELSEENRKQQQEIDEIKNQLESIQSLLASQKTSSEN